MLDSQALKAYYSVMPTPETDPFIQPDDAGAAQTIYEVTLEDGRIVTNPEEFGDSSAYLEE